MPLTISGYSMVKFTPLDDALSEVFELKASPEEGQSLQLKDEKKERGKKIKKPKSLKI